MPNTNLAYVEHRWGRRIPCSAPVRLITHGEPVTARLRDLSMSGAFVETESVLPVFARVTLAILREDGSQREQRLNAVVIRVAVDGIGVEWCETPAGPVCPVLGCSKLCAAARS
jgi:hypothetical protein